MNDPNKAAVGGSSSIVLLERLRAGEEIFVEAKEYGEGYPVELSEARDGELAIMARTEGGYAFTVVNLRELVQWAMEHAPDLCSNAE